MYTKGFMQSVCFHDTKQSIKQIMKIRWISNNGLRLNSLILINF